MGAYEIDLFNHRISVDPEFREGILAGDEKAWNAIAFTRQERSALESADIAWLYAHGANDFLLHNIFRFKISGVTIESYVQGIKHHLRAEEPDIDEPVDQVIM
jgi:hypothetical protein